MKQLILSIITLLTLNPGIKGQNYVPFPTENVNWNVYYVGTCQERFLKFRHVVLIIAKHICFKENGEVKYLNPAFDDCFPGNLLMGTNNTQIKIYPNPVNQEILMENNSDKNLFLKIIDINGR